MELINNFLNQLSKKKTRIAVVGDCMIDQYYNVKVERISPEFPIPVIKTSSGLPSSVKPGGAANVAYQMRHANVDVDLFCMMDKLASLVFKQFNDFEIKSVTLHDKEVPRKKRFYDGHFPVFRYDIEVLDYGSEELREQLYQLFKEEIKKNRPDIVVLSDYNKGVFNYNEPYLSRRLIALCRENEIPVIVDPKSGPLEQWKGCSVFKPNSIEAKAFTGKKEINDQLSYLHNALIDDSRNCQVMVTCGDKGVCGYNEKNFPTNPFWHFEAEPCKQLPSVIGAGDCFVAYFAIAYSQGFNIQESAQIANKASSIYVQECRNHPVRPLQLVRGYQAKVVTPNDLKDRSYSLAVTNGVFDVLHCGHLQTFKFAKTKADKLAVLVNSDESVKRLKGKKRPINTLENRMEMLSAIEDIDYIIPFTENSPYDTIAQLDAEVLVKGGDYQVKQIRSAELVKETFIVPLVEGLSTTEIIKKTIKSVEDAEKS